MSCVLKKFNMAAMIKTENSNAEPVLQLKLETALIVENIVRNLDAKARSEKDLKIVVDSIFQREFLIRQLRYIITNQQNVSSTISEPEPVEEN